MKEVTGFETPANCPKCDKEVVVDQPPMREFEYVGCATIHCCGLQFAADSALDALNGWNATCRGYSQAAEDFKAQVAELTRERDNFKSEWDQALALANKIAGLMCEMDDRRLAAEAKVARLEGALKAWKAAGTDEEYYKAVQLRNAALTEGDTANG